MSSCDCNNPTSGKGKQPQSPDIPDINKPDDSPQTSLNEALTQLAQETQASDPGSVPKKIYQFICSLPKETAYTNIDNKKSHISGAKNGHELFDKMLALFTTTEIIPDAFTWLVDKKLLDLNEANEQGKATLEKILETWFSNERYYSLRFQQIAELAVEKGAKISPEKAGSILERVLERLFNEDLDPEDYREIITFLEKQGATISSEKAGKLLGKTLEKLLPERTDPKTYSNIITCLETQKPKLDSLEATKLWKQFIQKSINQGNKLRINRVDFSDILDLLQKQGVSLLQTEATQLLQQAGAKGETTLYSRLIDLGADSNTEVSAYGTKSPLLRYSCYTNEKLFEKIVQDPKTTAETINKTDENNFTLAMDIAYGSNSPVNSFKLLLNNPLLDINTTKSNRPGTEIYTLLDIIVSNCINIERGGPEFQKKNAIERAQKWFSFLKSNELVQHSNFFVTQENIDKTTAKLHKLTDAKGTYIGDEKYYEQSLEIAQQAVDFLISKKK